MKRTENKGNRYSRVAIILHWVIAALIFANLVVGFFMEGLTGSLRSSAIASIYRQA
jgi:cytochrome b561